MDRPQSSSTFALGLIGWRSSVQRRAYSSEKSSISSSTDVSELIVMDATNCLQVATFTGAGKVSRIDGRIARDEIARELFDGILPVL